MKNIIVFLVILFSVGAYAQKETKLAVTQQQAIEVGLKNRFDVKANQYNIFISDNTITKSKNEWLPVLNLNGSVQYNTQLQTMYIPSGFGSATGPSLFAFAAKNTTAISLELRQRIFDPVIHTDIKIAKNELALQKEKNQAEMITIRDIISQAYLNVLLKELQYKIAMNDEVRHVSYFNIAQGKYGMGQMTENDYLRIKLDLENARIQAKTSHQDFDLAITNLKYQMNIPSQTVIELIDTLDIEPNVMEAFSSSDPQSRTEVKQLKIQQESILLQKRRAKQAMLPTLSFVGNYSQQFLFDTFDYSRSKWWTPFSYIGLRLNIPLSSIITSKSVINDYELKSAQSEFAFKQLISDVDNEVKTAATKLLNAWQNAQVTKNNYELSQKIYLNQKQQFDIGSFLYSDLLDTERSSSVAEQNYIKATYEYLLAKLRWQKVNGKM